MSETEIIKELVNLTLEQTRDEFEWVEFINKLQTKAKQYFVKIINNS